MFVTTGGRTDPETVQRAEYAARQLQLPYIPRMKRSIATLQITYGGDCLVVGRQRLELYKAHQPDPFFFHPNVAMLRIKRLLKGEEDPLIFAAGIKEGSTVLDCTLGLGADAIVASFVSGENGKVQGVEESPLLAFVVEKGLETWHSGSEAIDRSLRRIKVNTSNHLEVLKSSKDNSFDVVYFDPMFEETITDSNGIKPLTYFASGESLTEELIDQARRVAKERVVLKDHFRSDRFARFGFQVLVRKTSKFHFGYINA